MNTLPHQQHTHKQVLVVRKDLNMRKGKMAAQASHACVGAVFPREAAQVVQREDGRFDVSWTLDAGQLEWFLELSTKIVVGVSDEAQLLDVYHQALAAHLPCVLIQDRGFTEFGGVPTYTAVGIGPADQAAINAITGGLPLM